MAIGPAGGVDPVTPVGFNEVSILGPQLVQGLTVEQHHVHDGNSPRQRDRIVGSGLVQFPPVQIVKDQPDLISPGLTGKVDPLARLNLEGCNDVLDLLQDVVLGSYCSEVQRKLPTLMVRQVSAILSG